MHMAYGPANGNARGVAIGCRERILDLHRRLRENGSFNENTRSFGQLRELCNAFEKDVNSLYVSTWGKNRKMNFSLHRRSLFRGAWPFNLHNFRDWQQDNPHVVHRFKYQDGFSVNALSGIVSKYLIHGLCYIWAFSSDWRDLWNVSKGTIVWNA